MMQLHAYISGRVQMVGFRYNTRNRAQKLGITGWVRNLSDGRVEVLGEGTQEQLNNFLSWLRQGPRMANVSNIDYSMEKNDAQFTHFSIRH